MLFRCWSGPLALVALTALGACHTEEIEPHSAPTPTVPASAAGTSPPASHVLVDKDMGPEPRPGPRLEEPSVSLDQVEGADLARTRTAFAQVSGNVKRCSPGKRGTLSVRVTYTEDHTKLSVETPGQLDNESRHCVLENLSVVDYDGVLQRKSASERPSGFSALIHIEW